MNNSKRNSIKLPKSRSGLSLGDGTILNDKPLYSLKKKKKKKKNKKSAFPEVYADDYELKKTYADDNISEISEEDKKALKMIGNRKAFDIDKFAFKPTKKSSSSSHKHKKHKNKKKKKKYYSSSDTNSESDSMSDFDSNSDDSNNGNDLDAPFKPKKHKKSFKKLKGKYKVSSNSFSGPSDPILEQPPQRRKGGFEKVKLEDDDDFFSEFDKNSPEAEEAEKRDLISKFNALRKRGIDTSKRYTMKSSITDMRLEMGKLEHERNVQKIKSRSQRIMSTGLGTFESFQKHNKKVPAMFRGRLNGFSSYVASNFDEYDEALEQLAENWSGSFIGSTGSPYMDILMVFCWQLLMFTGDNLSKSWGFEGQKDQLDDIDAIVENRLAKERRQWEIESQEKQKQFNEQILHHQKERLSTISGFNFPPQQPYRPATSMNNNNDQNVFNPLYGNPTPMPNMPAINHQAQQVHLDKYTDSIRREQQVNQSIGAAPPLQTINTSMYRPPEQKVYNPPAELNNQTLPFKNPLAPFQTQPSFVTENINGQHQLDGLDVNQPIEQIVKEMRQQPPPPATISVEEYHKSIDIPPPFEVKELEFMDAPPDPTSDLPSLADNIIINDGEFRNPEPRLNINPKPTMNNEMPDRAMNTRKAKNLKVNAIMESSSSQNQQQPFNDEQTMEDNRPDMPYDNQHKQIVTI